MLPAYVSFFMGSDTDRPRSQTASLTRGLIIGSVVSSGFIAVFGITGILLTLGLQSITDLLPWLALVIGIGLAGLGLAMIRGRYLKVRLPGFRGPKKERSLRGLFLFGVSYSISSLSCTLPVFLSLIPVTLSQENLVGGVVTFLVYGLGMSTALVFLTVALSLGRTSIVGWMRSSAKYINTGSGVILVLAGLFIVWYWASILSSGSVDAGSNGLVRWVDGLSASATQFVADHTRIVIATLIGAIGSAVLFLVGKRALAPEQPDLVSLSD